MWRTTPTKLHSIPSFVYSIYPNRPPPPTPFSSLILRTSSPNWIKESCIHFLVHSFPVHSIDLFYSILHSFSSNTRMYAEFPPTHSPNKNISKFAHILCLRISTFNEERRYHSTLINPPNQLNQQTINLHNFCYCRRRRHQQPTVKNLFGKGEQ
jgi:hypothetical protein